ncbi:MULTISPECIES: hypothetical protein [Streptomyces]|uniref:Uncharacterized protein n=1 Tax=Streptomyces solicathayae TaxID=3081768 RepID=A0ABZ0LMD5_9ACTN|nr:hypothetical protein [Streptomyces sp. HUAS YS2]WOX20658.1 hypothetical protein R2D22_04320 [Streptomyces sp. HUAS YS2]
MRHDQDTDRALDVLLSFAEADDAARVRERIRLEDRPAAVPDRWTAIPRIAASSVPVSARQWMLEADDPEINELVVLSSGLPGALELSVLKGEPFGPDGGRTLPLNGALRGRPMPEGVRRFGPGEAVPALRAVRTMRQGRAAANQLGRADWTAVIEADVEQPLPGFARWALALRPDCPNVLRQRFSDHPSYAHRMRTGGIIDGPAEYVREWRSARTVLTVLDTGRWAFPARMPEAEAVLRPLVRDSLGGNLEAWAVLAQLLPTFTGTAPELIVTSGAIA